jgi:hypothetical protein
MNRHEQIARTKKTEGPGSPSLAVRSLHIVRRIEQEDLFQTAATGDLIEAGTQVTPVILAMRQ